MNRTAVLIAVVLSGSLLWSCSDSKSSNKEAVISEAVSMEILTQLMSQTMMLGSGVINNVDETGSFQFQHTKYRDVVAETLSETIPCSEGGSMVVNGTFTNNMSAEGTGSVSFDVRNNPSDCGIATSGGVFRINGNPDLRTTFAMNYSVGESVGILTFTFTGGYVWTGAGGTGSCNLNISYSINYDNSGSVNLSGSMCGYSFS